MLRPGKEFVLASPGKENFLENVTTVVTALFGWIGNVATTIASNSLLLIPLAIALVGAAISFGMRLMGTRRGKRR